MIDPALTARARRLLDEARLIAEAPAARAADVRAAAKRAVPGTAHARTRSAAHGDSAEPPGAWRHDRSTLDACGQRINRAIADDDEAELARACDWCRAELDLLKRGVPGRREETIAERRVRIARDYAGVPAPTVARKERMSVSLVRSDREAAGLEPASGIKLPARLRQFS